MGCVPMILSQHRPNLAVSNFRGKSWGMFKMGEPTSQVREQAGPISANATYVVDGG